MSKLVLDVPECYFNGLDDKSNYDQNKHAFKAVFWAEPSIQTFSISLEHEVIEDFYIGLDLEQKDAVLLAKSILLMFET